MSDLADVRSALAGLLRANLDGYDVRSYAPDSPSARSAWVWIDEVDYRDPEAVGGGYGIDATIQVAMPRISPSETQDRADELMDEHDGLPSWLRADRTLNGDARIAYANRASLGYADLDDTTIGVVTFNLTIYT